MNKANSSNNYTPIITFPKKEQNIPSKFAVTIIKTHYAQKMLLPMRRLFIAATWLNLVLAMALFYHTKVSIELLPKQTPFKAAIDSASLDDCKGKREI